MTNKPETGSFDPSVMSGGDPTAMLQMMGPYMAVIGIIGLAIFIFYIFVWWKIFSKAGYSGALALLNLAIIIPFIGWIVPLILTIWFAFADWPVRKGMAAGAAPAKT
jgi:hypothetical protein